MITVVNRIVAYTAVAASLALAAPSIASCRKDNSAKDSDKKK
jgi:hypothetical protein